MRSLLCAGWLLLVPSWLLAQEKPEPGPIRIADLKRDTPVSYEKEIEPIFAKRCFVCHSGSVKKSRFDISSYEGLIKGGRRGSPIMPGKGDSSPLIKYLARTVKPFMPPRGEEPCTPEEIALIRLWIDQGARAPTSTRTRPTVTLTGLPANVHPIHALALSPDKNTVAVGRGNHIYLYETNSGKLLRSLVAPGLKLPSGKEVAAAHLSLVESLAYSPDGKTLVSGSFQEVAIWDPTTGTLRHKLTGFAHRVMALAFSPDGKLLATGGGAPTEEGEIKFFDTATWNLVGQVKNGHSDTVYGLCFSPDGKLLASAAADKFVKVFEVPSGKFVKAFEGHTHHVLDVGWQANGKLLASAGADNTIKVWDYEKGEQVRTIPAHNKQVTRLLFIGKTSQVITCSGDQNIKIFNVENGSVVRGFGGMSGFVYALAVSADGTIVVAGGDEGVARVYNGTNGASLRSLQPPETVAQAPAKK